MLLLLRLFFFIASAEFLRGFLERAKTRPNNKQASLVENLGTVFFFFPVVSQKFIKHLSMRVFGNGKDSSHVYHLQFLFWFVAGLGRRLWIGEGQSGNEITHSGQEPNWQFRYHWYTMISSMDLHNDQSWFCNEEFLNLGHFFFWSTNSNTMDSDINDSYIDMVGQQLFFSPGSLGTEFWDFLCVAGVGAAEHQAVTRWTVNTHVFDNILKNLKVVCISSQSASFCEFVSWCYGSLLTHVWISEIYCPVDKPFNIEMVVCSQKSGLVSNVAFLVSVFMLFGFPGCSSKCGFLRWQSSLGLWESVQQRFCLVLTWVNWVVVVACEQQAAGSDTKEGAFFFCLWERKDPFCRLLLLNLNKVFSWGRFIFWR